ncbi:MAG TPA: hypothetical protein PKM50_08740, partial [Methanoregula sp.]|nr:hypothetical protein [Methanoregula sp.]
TGHPHPMLIVEGVSCVALGKRTGIWGGTLDPHYPKGHSLPETKKVTPTSFSIRQGWQPIPRVSPREAQVLILEFKE